MFFGNGATNIIITSKLVKIVLHFFNFYKNNNINILPHCQIFRDLLNKLSKVYIHIKYLVSRFRRQNKDTDHASSEPHTSAKKLIQHSHLVLRKEKTLAGQDMAVGSLHPDDVLLATYIKKEPHSHPPTLRPTTTC